MAPSAAETLWSMLPDASAWDLSMQTIMDSYNYVRHSEKDIASYLKPAQRLRVALEHVLDICELSEFDTLLRSPYAKPSEALRFALDKATGSERSESWDLLFEELRMAMCESAALLKTIEMVQSLLGSSKSLPESASIARRGMCTPTIAPEPDSESISSHVSPRNSNPSSTPRRNLAQRSRLMMSHAPRGSLGKRTSRRSSPSHSTNGNDDGDETSKDELESQMEETSKAKAVSSTHCANLNPLQALLDEAEMSMAEFESDGSSSVVCTTQVETYSVDSPRNSNIDFHSKQVSSSSPMMYRGELASPILDAELHMDSNSVPLSAQVSPGSMPGVAKVGEMESQTDVSSGLVASPWPEWEVEADFARWQKKPESNNVSSIQFSDDEVEEADDLEDSPNYDALIARMSGIRASGQLLEVSRRMRQEERASRREEEEQQRQLQQQIHQQHSTRIREEELARQTRQNEEEQARKQDILRRERHETEKLRREEEEKMKKEMLKNQARLQAQARLRNSMESLMNATDVKNNECLQYGKEQVRQIIEAARGDGLSGDDLAEALSLERRLKKTCVDNVLEECRSVDLNNSEALCGVKERLTHVISQALADGAHEKDLIEAEKWRRRVHNRVEDLKGSIRVFCRVRPLSQKELSEGDIKVVRQPDSMTLEVERGIARSRRSGRSVTPPRYATPPRPTQRASVPSVDRVGSGEREGSETDVTVFRFDSVFAPASQREVFEDCCELMQSVFDGYNVTIFAYGQTGAGKTYTMTGSIEQPGLTPQVVHEIYRIIEQDDSRFRHSITTSMVELYRNELVDLLQISQFTQPAKRASMRKDREGSVHLENVVEEDCPDAETLAEIVERGNMFRKTAATAMNSESSRSHLILTVKISRTNRQTGDTSTGKLVLVDLAGSERLKKSLVTGELQKDSIEINKSLTALGDVIEALTQGHSSVPYRNHKLTQLLQDALGQSAKTLMFVHCSPAKSNLEETLATLKYATRAKKIKRSTTPRGFSTPRGTPRGS